MTFRVAIGSLNAGDAFITSLRGLEGLVLEPPRVRKNNGEVTNGVVVRFADGIRVLHKDVIVLVARQARYVTH